MLEVADIFREAGPAYRERYGSNMLPSHLAAMEAIEACRTEAMGGHLRECDSCHQRQYSYHSCRNRHCPKCHGDKTRRWLEDQRARFLDCSYYLVTFTLPAELRPVAKSHQKLVYGLLMREAAASLTKLALDPRFLGAKPAMIAVLHTWTRAMLFHPHVHILATAGGLSPDLASWVEPKNPRFLVPDRALSKIFRAKVRDALDQGSLLGRVPTDVWRNPWVVDCKHAGDGTKVLDYLGRYIYRIAIANSRIERYEDGEVTFRYKDNKTQHVKRCHLTGEQFIGRFLQHVLPRGFIKVRHYGLYSSASSKKLERARTLLGERADATSTLDTTTLEPAGDSTTDNEALVDSEASPERKRCSVCGEGEMLVIATITCTFRVRRQRRKKRPP